MKDTDTTTQGNDDPRRVQVPHRTDTHFSVGSRNQDAAAHIVRAQLDKIYDTNPPNQPQTPPAASVDNPYDRTHSENPMAQASQSEAWKQYHSSWQKYYQEYYQRYYLQQLEAQKQELAQKSKQDAELQPAAIQPQVKEKTPPTASTEPTHQFSTNTNPAVRLLNHEIVQKIKQQASDVRRSAHFMPLISAVVVGVLFMFVQYNRMFVASVKAYVSPGSTASQSIILDPTTNTKVSDQPRVIIPKINVDAPVVYGLTSIAENDVQNALKDGVVHYPIPGANSLPGQNGNTVLLGHSSNDVFDDGDYKFVFLMLEKLEVGDTFYVHYQGTRYTYAITNKEVILPNEVSKLILPADKPRATLITCVPIGTALKRLIVTAEQVSPSPSNATVAPEAAAAKKDPAALPGYSPTFLDRIFGN